MVVVVVTGGSGAGPSAAASRNLTLVSNSTATFRAPVSCCDVGDDGSAVAVSEISCSMIGSTA